MEGLSFAVHYGEVLGFLEANGIVPATRRVIRGQSLSAE